MNEDKRRGFAREALSQYIADNHLRRTPERFAMLDMVLEMQAHFTTDELCRAVEEGDFRVSKATIYNALKLFAAVGIIRRLHLSSNTWVVTIDRPTMVTTIRLLCEQCGKIREVRDAQLARSLSLKRYQSFAAKSFELCVTGCCTRCIAKSKRKNKDTHKNYTATKT